ncbi:MAG: tetratricopeptide repeat protein [Bacteroidia bacterium]|nr:tetratricopeptide repeat protein [Bacteroidia bacterium]
MADSLNRAFNATNDDSLKCQILYYLMESDYDPAVWSPYNDKLGALSLENFRKQKGHVRSYYLFYYSIYISNVGYLYNIRGDYQNALKYYNFAQKFQKGLENYEGAGGTLNNIGYIYRIQGNIPMALNHYYEALKMFEKAGNQNNMAACYNNIAFVNVLQGEYLKAEELYNKAIAIVEKLKDKSSIGNYTANKAKLYYSGNIKLKGGLKEGVVVGIELLEKARQLQTEINDTEKLSGTLNVLASLIETYGDPKCIEDSLTCAVHSKKRAYELYLEALHIREKVGDKPGLAQSYSSLSSYYARKGDIKTAIDFAQKSHSLALELGFPELIENSSEELSTYYKKSGLFDKALDMQILFVQMRDSVNNINTRKENIKKRFEYEYKSQAVKDSISNANKLTEEKFRHEQAIGQQKLFTYGGFIGLALMLVVAGVSFKAYKDKQKANVLITEQKQIAEQQKHLVEEKQKEILDSIAYAKRLQEAILPPQNIVTKHLPDNFILYLPKDIVAGDFYWFEYLDNASYMAAADSTGHGVPGAMVSVVCSNALNRAVHEFGLRSPGEILDKTRELVLETFAKSDKDVKDGMDISLVKITELPAEKNIPGRLVIPKGQTLKDVISSQTKYKIEWAGANNPLWYYSEGQIHEIKAHKQPIGKTEQATPFPTHTFELMKGDELFLLTDGFADQFGGPKGKKFKYKQLEETMVSLVSAPMVEQKKILNNTFTSWKGNLEQVDDITIIGIRL